MVPSSVIIKLLKALKIPHTILEGNGDTSELRRKWTIVEF